MIDGESEGGHCDDAQDEVNQEKSENVARWVLAIYSISTQHKVIGAVLEYARPVWHCGLTVEHRSRIAAIKPCL